MNAFTQIQRKVAQQFATSVRRSISVQSKLLWSSQPITPTLRQFHTTLPKSNPETVSITFVDSDEKEYTVDAEVGKSFLDVAHDNNIELEGACGGELACATCHLIYSQEVYDTLPEKEPEEDDMLDLAFELTDT